MVSLLKVLKYSIIGSGLTGTAYSLHNNHYQIDSIGIVRLARAAIATFEVGVYFKRDLYGSNLIPGSEEYLELKSKVYKKSAERLLELCCTNRGVYIKVGQHMAALDYLLPKEFVDTMKILHSHAPKNDIKDIYKVIREEFKQEPLTLFKSIDPEPLGAASLAQVHKATLHDGSVVAVKVQHPYVRGNAQVDLKTMEGLVKIMGWIFPDFKFQWLVDETKKNIPRELNFKEEGTNAERVEKEFANVNWLTIPKIRWDYSTPRVLTMDFVEGGQVNDLEYMEKNKINPFDVSDKLGLLYSQMIFINGFVHSDPHPGNILVKKSARGDCDILLLDHGLYAELSDEFRVNYAQLWLSILNKDRTGMKSYAKNLGIDGELYGILACMVSGRTWYSIEKGIVSSKPDQSEKQFVKREIRALLPQISNVLDSVNRQMLLIFKTNDLIRGIEHNLKTTSRMGAFKIMSTSCVTSVYDERYRNTMSKIRKFSTALVKYWTLLKINVYYTFMAIINRQ